MRGCRVVVFLAGALLAEVFLAVVFLAVLAVLAVVFFAVLAVLVVRPVVDVVFFAAAARLRGAACFVAALRLVGVDLLAGAFLAGAFLAGAASGGAASSTRCVAWAAASAASAFAELALALLVRLQLLGQLALGRQAILLDGTRQGLGLLGPLLQPLRLLLGRLSAARSVLSSRRLPRRPPTPTRAAPGSWRPRLRPPRASASA